MCKKIKYFFQRLFRGYSDVDLWNYGEFVCKKILPSLKAFIKMERHGYPAEFKNRAEWEKVLQEILWAVEEIAYNKGEDKITDKYFPDSSSRKLTDEEREKMGNEIGEYWERCEKGMELFGKYLPAMWD